MKVPCVLVALVSLLLAEESCFAAKMTNSWAVKIKDAAGKEEVDAMAKKHGFVNLGLVANLNDIYHFQRRDQVTRDRSVVSDYPQADHLTGQLQAEPNVVFAKQQVRKTLEKRGYHIPNDPHYDRQWYLENTGFPYFIFTNNDNNIEGGWLQGYTGCGVVVGVVDDGVAFDHDDLISGYSFDLEYDFLYGIPDGYPVWYDGAYEAHGTSCAGEIGMRKNNGVCGTGVAYNSVFTGLRLISSVEGATEIQEAQALTWKNDVIDIYSNSWGPPDSGEEVEGLGDILLPAVQKGIAQGRDGKGSIFIFAAGNGREQYDTCAADGFVSSIYTISVGSVAVSGDQSFYDERCSGKLLTVFTDDDFVRGQDVVTTEPGDRCVDDFIGTSASTPIVSGAVALLLEANPALTWRDVQYLLAYTARPHGLVDPEWTTNGAGLKVSHKFGFGALDAESLVSRGRNWINVPEQVDKSFTIPQNTFILAGGQSAVRSITISDSNIAYLEHVVVVFSVWFEVWGSASMRGKMEVDLESPSGTVSLLLEERPLDQGSLSYENWPLMTVHSWGENPTGVWNITVRNKNWVTSRPKYAIVELSAIKLYGTATIPAAVANIPAECAPECDSTRGCAGPGSDKCDVCAEFRVMETHECVSSCPEGQVARKKYCYNPTTPERACQA